MRFRHLFLVVALTAAAACGTSGSTGGSQSPTAAPPPTPQTISITENEFTISPATINLKAGNYVFQLQNSGKAPHDLHIVDSTNQPVAGTTAVLPAAGTGSFTATLKAGTYTMFCAVDSHRARGMQGTVTVS
jgi:plastocyanin